MTDHKPIEIIIDLNDFKWEKINTKVFVKNKKFMEKQNNILLERLYVADTLREIKAAFAWR